MKITTPIAFALLLLGLGGTATAESRTFSADLKAENVIDDGAIASASTATGIGTFELTWDPADLSTATLSYELQLNESDLDGLQTSNLGDDVTAIHIHDLNQCGPAGCSPGDSAGTIHVLNVFGAPREDDADLLVVPETSTLTGIWDASDATDQTPAPTFTPGEYIDELLAGDIFVMVHTREFPGGAFGGALVPEPASASLCLLAVPFVGALRKRRK